MGSTAYENCSYATERASGSHIRLLQKVQLLVYEGSPRRTATARSIPERNLGEDRRPSQEWTLRYSMVIEARKPDFQLKNLGMESHRQPKVWEATRVTWQMKKTARKMKTLNSRMFDTRVWNCMEGVQKGMMTGPGLSMHLPVFCCI